MQKVASEIRKIDLLKIVEKQIVKNEDYITELNTNQLFAGEKSNGQSLPNYSPTSVNVFGKPSGAIRLYDEGDFYDGFYLSKKDSFPFELDSRDSKSDELQDRYGIEIFGLTNDSTDDLNEEILPEIQSSFIEQIQKSFNLL